MSKASELPSALDQPTMEDAIGKAVYQAALTHARLGNPVAAMRDGKVVWLQPEEVMVLLKEYPKNGTTP